jgi:hypothetical protein
MAASRLGQQMMVAVVIERASRAMCATSGEDARGVRGEHLDAADARDADPASGERPSA